MLESDGLSGFESTNVKLKNLLFPVEVTNHFTFWMKKKSVEISVFPK